MVLGKEEQCILSHIEPHTFSITFILYWRYKLSYISGYAIQTWHKKHINSYLYKSQNELNARR